MRELILILIFFFSVTISVFAQQKKDYTTYDVVAKSGNIHIVAKKDDYRMLIGTLKKPMMVFLLGYTKEQATQRFKRFIEICEDKKYAKSNRQESFCGVDFYLTTEESGSQSRYIIVQNSNKIKCTLLNDDIQAIETQINSNLKQNI